MSMGNVLSLSVEQGHLGAGSHASTERFLLFFFADQIRLPGIVCRLFLFMYNYCSTRIEGTAPPHTIDARRAQNAARETLWVHTTTTCTCIECTYVVRIRMVLACLNCLFSFFFLYYRRGGGCSIICWRGHHCRSSIYFDVFFSRLLTDQPPTSGTLHSLRSRHKRKPNSLSILHIFKG